MFALEKELSLALRPSLARLIRRHSARSETVRAEVRVGMVIPDFIVASWRRASLPTLTMFEAEVVAMVAHRGAHLDNIAERLFVTDGKILECVRKLQAKEVLTLDAGGHVTASSRRRDRDDAHIVAVEAKLARWREAIEQADKYRAFANDCYVALPDALVSSNAQVAANCASRGVGLIAVGSASSKVIVKPQRTVGTRGEWYWLLGKLQNERVYQRCCLKAANAASQPA